MDSREHAARRSHADDGSVEFNEIAKVGWGDDTLETLIELNFLIRLFELILLLKLD